METMSYFMTQKVNEKKSEIKQIVSSNEESITDLIKPQNLTHQDVDSWENVDIELLKDEICMGMGEWTYGDNHPYESQILELAILYYMQDMTRIPEKHLDSEKFQEVKDFIIEGYWLHSWSFQECREYVYEYHGDIDFFHDCENEAMAEIESWIIDERLIDLE